MSRGVAPPDFFIALARRKWHARASLAWRSCRRVREVARGGSCELKWWASSVSWLAEVGGATSATLDFSTSLFTQKRKNEIKKKKKVWIQWLWKTPRVVGPSPTFALSCGLFQIPFYMTWKKVCKLTLILTSHQEQGGRREVKEGGGRGGWTSDLILFSLAFGVGWLTQEIACLPFRMVSQVESWLVLSTLNWFVYFYTCRQVIYTKVECPSKRYRYSRRCQVSQESSSKQVTKSEICILCLRYFVPVKEVVNLWITFCSVPWWLFITWNGSKRECKSCFWNVIYCCV